MEEYLPETISLSFFVKDISNFTGYFIPKPSLCNIAIHEYAKRTYNVHICRT